MGLTPLVIPVLCSVCSVLTKAILLFPCTELLYPALDFIFFLSSFLLYLSLPAHTGGQGTFFFRTATLSRTRTATQSTLPYVSATLLRTVQRKKAARAGQAL